MSAPIISTKLHIPPLRSKAVLRHRLTGRLIKGMKRKLSLVSASAGYGKTTLVAEWLSRCTQPVAWLSLEEGDNEPARFLTYFIAALRKISANIGEAASLLLQSPQLPTAESVIASLINEITSITDHFVLVLDDYHVINANGPINDAVVLLLERMPPQMHLVIITREDPRLPLARLRVRDDLTEIRAADLRFTSSETTEFLDGVMGLSLAPEQVALLESRTEGWIAGLQLAALSMQGHEDPAQLISSFTGSHRFVLDYLVEEVLKKQPAAVQHFLLSTSILDRLCGPLCDAVLDSDFGEQSVPFTSGREILAYLEQANLFIVPLDDERRWYRYHHLFAELLRKRLHQSGDERQAAELHLRASQWYEDHNLLPEAFHHAAAAQDTGRAARLLEGEGMPLIFRGAVAPLLQWLHSLPRAELDAWPALWVMYASALLLTGQMSGVEPKLQAAEKKLEGYGQDKKTRDLIGHIAAIRATLAVSKHQADMILAESQRALDFLDPDNLPVRTATVWTLGYAHQLQGDRAAAREAYTEALSSSRSIGHIVITIMSALGLGNLQEADNQLDAAAETYREVLAMAGDPPLPTACEAHLGLARIRYEWNDPEAAMKHGLQSVELARQLEHTDRAVAGEVLLARLKLARGDSSGAAALLAEAERTALRLQFASQLQPIAAAKVLVLLRQGRLMAASRLAQKHELPVSLARVCLAQGDPSAALALLEPLREQAEIQGLEDELLRIIVLQAAALYAHGGTLNALWLLEKALTAAEPGGFIRLFIDEGVTMFSLLREAAAHEILPDYTGRLLAAFEAEARGEDADSGLPQAEPGSNPAEQHVSPFVQPLVEPLSGRELEVLQLIAQGLSNREIGERLFIALPTVKGHNRMIFDKLQVTRRTEAIARARNLGLL
ncbi:LuxR family transcriptional regulator [Paenibacillus sp. H1-7]|uniref:LuxR C-terminal-related transcriptional regulator n=1 Tax=Paenibacillus sp. H1-7 TaxID=2282849 RepID=UPI001EF8DE3D|nr:LuxR C-terminal-related transcriptional regulator [Paenibacillus sp. H1-7]ULL18180.1 LuxR family transcriptional regulator [Paenibacillus sp. H1-7]